MKSVQKRSFFWSEFSHIRTEYGEIAVFLRIQTKCGQKRTRKNSVFGHFSRSVSLKEFVTTSYDKEIYLDTKNLQQEKV